MIGPPIGLQVVGKKLQEESKLQERVLARMKVIEETIKVK